MFRLTVRWKAFFAAFLVGVAACLVMGARPSPTLPSDAGALPMPNAQRTLPPMRKTDVRPVSALHAVAALMTANPLLGADGLAAAAPRPANNPRQDSAAPSPAWTYGWAGLNVASQPPVASPLVVVNYGAVHRVSPN